MRVLLLLIFLACVVASCNWTPDRDNPYDPDSQFYIPPPPTNHAPVISMLRTITHKRYGLNDIYSMEVLSTVEDQDGNMKYDSIMVIWQGLTMGTMSFDGERELFAISLTAPENFPVTRWEELDQDTFWIEARDNDGAMARAYTVYNLPSGGQPAVRFPATQADTLHVLQPVLYWYQWSLPTGSHTYSIQVDYQGIYSAWDTTGLPANLDSVKIGIELLDSAEDGDRFYLWFLTVTDDFGNTITSIPGYLWTFVGSQVRADNQTANRE